MHRYFRAVRSNTPPPSVPAGCAKLRGSRDWFPAGLYMPFGRPQNAIRSSYRENVGNRGQDLIFQIKSCCRRRRECIGIRANCGKYLHVPCFFSYGFLASGPDSEMAYTAPAGSRCAFHLAPPYHPLYRISPVLCIRYFCVYFCLLCLSILKEVYCYLWEQCIGQHVLILLDPLFAFFAQCI